MPSIPTLRWEKVLLGYFIIVGVPHMFGIFWGYDILEAYYLWEEVGVPKSIYYINFLDGSIDIGEGYSFFFKIMP